MSWSFILFSEWRLEVLLILVELLNITVETFFLQYWTQDTERRQTKQKQKLLTFHFSTGNGSFSFCIDIFWSLSRTRLLPHLAMNYTTDTLKEAGTTNPTRAHGYTPGFMNWVVLFIFFSFCFCFVCLRSVSCVQYCKKKPFQLWCSLVIAIRKYQYKRKKIHCQLKNEMLKMSILKFWIKTFYLENITEILGKNPLPFYKWIFCNFNLVFQLWCSTIPPISTKPPTSTHWTK
jgi:hypothetical protein